MPLAGSGSRSSAEWAPIPWEAPGTKQVGRCLDSELRSEALWWRPTFLMSSAERGPMVQEPPQAELMEPSLLVWALRTSHLRREVRALDKTWMLAGGRTLDGVLVLWTRPARDADAPQVMTRGCDPGQRALMPSA